MDLSRYCIGKGREEQVDLLSEDELSDFYSQEDLEKLETIETEFRHLCKQFYNLFISNYF